MRGENIYAQIDKHPSTAELKQKAAIACDPKIPLSGFRFQCLHGLGHALLFFSRYQLAQSLEVCDVLPESWSRKSCYGGVFMENVFNATPETRDLSPTDYHYPCNKLAAKYRGECYVMQTSRMTEMGLVTERIFQECEKPASFATIARSQSAAICPTKCASATLAPPRKNASSLAAMPACLHARRRLRADRQHLGRPLRAAVLRDLSAKTPTKTLAFRLSAQYLQGTFEKSPAEIAKDCASQLSQPSRCVESMAR